jgi:AcrR family transcriptional regulator
VMTQAAAAPTRRTQPSPAGLEPPRAAGGDVPEGARARLLDAMRDLAAADGPARVDPAVLCARADVPSAVFARLFAGTDDLFAAVVARELERLVDEVVAAAGAAGAWPAGAAAAIRTFFAALDRDPRTAWLCVVETSGTDPRLRAARATASARIGALLRPPAGEDDDVPAGADAMLVGGLWELAYQRLAGRGPDVSMTDLAAPAVHMVLAPHVGAAAARALAEGRA